MERCAELENEKRTKRNRDLEKKNTSSAINFLKLRLIFSAIFLLVLALGFNAVLSLSSLERLYVESIVSKYSVIGKDLKRNVEKALTFGKRIEKFIRMEDLLTETKRNLLRRVETREDETLPQVMVSETEVDVSISVPEGNILYSTNPSMVGQLLPSPARFEFEGEKPVKNSAKTTSYVKHQGMYYIAIPIIGGFSKSWVANTVITFSEKQVKSLLYSALMNYLRNILIIFCVSVLVLILLLNVIIRRQMDPSRFPKLKIYLVMFFIIGMSQIVFTGLSINDFKNYYLQIVREKTGVLAAMLKEDIEFFLSKGLKITRLVRMDVMMEEVLKAAPELANITITDDSGIPLYMATKEGSYSYLDDVENKAALDKKMETVTDPKYRLVMQLTNSGTAEGYIYVESYDGLISVIISKQVLFNRLKEIALDYLTVLLISFLFFVEMFILIFQFIKRKFIEVSSKYKVTYQAMRPAAFLFIIGYAVSNPFLPLHMENLYEPIFGLSKDLVMGLPISVRVFCAGLSIIIAGGWLDRRGWHEPFFTGLLFLAGGYIYAWLAPNAIHFIASLGIVGIGYGFSLMAAQGFVIAHTDEKSKTQGLSQLYAGVYAGAICGSAIGGMLAERIGYRPVFLCGAIIIVCIFLYTLYFMREAIRRPETVDHGVHSPGESVKAGKVVRFIFSRNVISLIILSSIPAAIATVGFLNYFSPIYLNRIGTSESNIGRIFMMHGLCIIYIAPFLSKFVDASSNKKTFIVIGDILGSLAFISFYFAGLYVFGGIFATAAAVLFLGLSTAFADTRSSYILKLKITRELGSGKAMGIFSSAERIGQVLGPILIGWIVVALGMNKGILYIGIIYLLATLFFLIIAQNDKYAGMERKNDG